MIIFLIYSRNKFLLVPFGSAVVVIVVVVVVVVEVVVDCSIAQRLSPLTEF